jgi:ribosomal protein L11 methylase PrmA
VGDQLPAAAPPPGALATIRSNAARNGVAIDVRWGDVTSEVTWAPAVVANLSRPLLVGAAERCRRPPERLLASGFLADEADEVVAAWGLREKRRLVEHGWAALELSAS